MPYHARWYRPAHEWSTADVEVIEPTPFRNEGRFDRTEPEVLDEHGKNVAYASGRGRKNGLDAESVRNDSEFLARGPVRSRERLRPEINGRANVRHGEVEHSFQPDFVPKEMSRQECLDTDGLTFSQSLEFGGSTGTAGADVEHRKAPRGVEPTPVEPGPFGVERPVPGGDVPPPLATVRPDWC